MAKDRNRAPPSPESEFWDTDKPATPVQTEWARGLIPRRVLTPPERLSADEALSLEPQKAKRSIDEAKAQPDEPTRQRSQPSGPTPQPTPAPPPADELPTGQTLGGRYRLERVLGSGGMGVVYLASDEQVPGETFAIKILKAGLRADALALLRAEVHKTRKLSHPNIVDVHSLNVDGSRLFVLMESLEGKPLNVLLDEDFGRGMPLSRARPIIEDVGAALACAHDHSVIHSDLKPANIFVTTSGRSKLLDFGIARASRGQAAQSGVFALTPAYASCEMLEGSEPDARDDIYSFACVIYEMLSGKRPFGTRDALEARAAGATAAPLPALSRSQNAALAKGLAFEREARTASVEELLAGLTADRPPERALLKPALAAAAVLVAALVGLALYKSGLLRHATRSSAAAATAAGFNPPPHSVAVLPFANLSGDKSQDYFSDGLTEELLNSLARINELQVAARTSSFTFKGKNVEVGEIGRQLNVAAVLEGSVRRSARSLRVTAQLINAATGFDLWSQSYDRDMGDVLKLQTDIANAVAGAMKVALLGDIAARVELGGTRNPAAFDAYLRAAKLQNSVRSPQDSRAAIGLYSDAIRLDPDYALALAGRSWAQSIYAGRMMAPGPGGDSERSQYFERAQADARRAIELAPDLAEGHMALAQYFAYGPLDFQQARAEYERAAALAPGNARVQRAYGEFSTFMGHTDAGLAARQRALILDPLNRNSHFGYGNALYFSRRYREAIAAYQDSLAIDPAYAPAHGMRGRALYASGNLEGARASCEATPDDYESEVCLAVTYNKLGRREDAQAVLAKLTASQGDVDAYQYAEIYAQWGDKAQALDWLEKALQLRDTGLESAKTDPLLDPLRQEPRYQAIERALKFPTS